MAATSAGMMAPPGTRSVVGDDAGGNTGDLDGATLKETSVVHHRGLRQCSPGDEDVGDAAQGT